MAISRSERITRRTPRERLPILVLVCVLAANAGGWASPPLSYEDVPSNFAHLTITDGLSQGTAFSILQDDLGFIWIGTEDGLNRYDGHTFKVYGPSDAPNSLTNNTGRILFKDSQGVLWIGTLHGLNRYNRETDDFARYLSDPDDPKTLSNNSIYSICEDADGILWIGTGGGVSSFDRTTEIFTRYEKEGRPRAEGLDGSTQESIIYALHADRTGLLWMATDGGLHAFEPKTGKMKLYASDPKDPRSLSGNSIRVIYEDREGLLWIGTDRYGVNTLDHRTGTITRYRNDYRNPRSLSHNTVYAISQDREGKVWIATNGGLSRFNAETKDFDVIRNDPRNPASLSYDYVVSIFEDRSGVLWFGTRGRGIDQFARDRVKFGLYRNRLGDPNSIGSNMIREIAEDAEGNLWIATEDKGLEYLDRTNRVFRHLRHDPGDPRGLSSDYVYAVQTAPSGLVWVGTMGSGLNAYDPRTKSFVHYRHDPRNPKSLCGDTVRSLRFDSRGTLWVGTDGAGLCRFVSEQGSFVHYPADVPGAGRLSFGRVRVIFEDRTGRLWVGTFGGGLNLYDRERDAFTVFRHDPDNPNSLCNNFIMSMAEDRDGRLWIGTEKGLNRYDPATGTFICFTEKDGFPNDAIYGVLVDDAGDVWVSTNRGMARLQPATRAVKSFSVSDGLQSNEFNGGSYFKTREGELFFGGMNGMNHFYAESIRENPYVPAVAITDFQIFNKSVGIGQEIQGRVVLEKSITQTDRLTLSYKHRLISFEFAALHFVAPEKNECAYIMEGLEKDWNYVRDRRFASYSNLTAGRYTFRVKAANNDGIWNEEGIAVKIRVIPPFWKTWWFIGLVALTVLGSTYGTVRTRVRNIRHRTTLLENTVRERTAELQRQMVVRKKAEDELEWRRKYLESILFNSSNAIVATDAGGAVIEWSPGAENIFGWTREEALGKNIDDLVTTSEFRGDAVERSRITLSGKRVDAYEAIRHRKDGVPINVIIASSPLAVGDEFVGGVAVYTDITELKKAEAAAKEANRAKSEFLANMSHEIRTPMNGIFGMTELALETSLSLEQREYIEAVKTSAESLMDIINDILDFSKIEAKKVDLECIPFRLRDAIHATVSGIAVLAEKKGLEIAYHIPVGIPDALIGDPGRIRQVLTNLLSNAVKFTSQGEIVVSLDVESRTAAGVRLHVQVRDTGIGIPPDRLQLMFDPFTQADSSTTRLYGGTGLGLAISKQLVELMDGRIWAESEPEKGSIFHFLASLGIQTEAKDETEPIRYNDLNNVSVLVVDDNATNLRILQDMLVHWGLKPTLANSAHQALDILRRALEAGSAFRLIITDANMPVMDGFDLAAEIRSHAEFGDPTIMMLSSAGIRGDSTRCRQLGLTAYLTKPVKQSLLLDAIMLALGTMPEGKAEAPLITKHSLVQARARYSVLLAEDNVINQKLAVRILENRGHRVTIAGNGREALEALDKETFDVVLMDVQMPLMDGFQATAEIRRREQSERRHLPIIAMTAHAMTGDRERCLDAGMDDYVPKPLKALDLLKTIEHIVQRFEKAKRAERESSTAKPRGPGAPSKET